MKLALAQLNPTLGDLDGNIGKILEAAKQAADQNPDLIVFPEMVVTGYPPRDLLNDWNFTQATIRATRDLAAEAASLPPLLLGSIARAKASLPNHPNLHNAAYLIQNGDLTMVAAKRLLPAYDVFHEPRWFVPGSFTPPFELNSHKIGVLICEDLWDEGYPVHPAVELTAAGADFLICISASPFRKGIFEKRLYHAGRASSHPIPLVFVNQVGANDELIFDGRSFVVVGDELAHCTAGFAEALSIFDTRFTKSEYRTSNIELSNIHAALTLGIRDFAHKNGLQHAFLGLSGGIDSALVAVLACQALGPQNVTCIAIPSRYSDPRSTESARELCQNLGCAFEVVDLEPLHEAAEQVLHHPITQSPNHAMENVQARLRMVILMGYVNQRGGFLLNTSNKTELSLGYSTLYGDMAGALCPIADLTKGDVYALAEFVNQETLLDIRHSEKDKREYPISNIEHPISNNNSGPIIPRFIFSRPPSAELRPNQVDPFDYPAISPRMENLVLHNQTDDALRHSEHKRWQMGIILKVSEKAFGTGRMMPVTKG